MGKTSRTKGASAEREVCKILRESGAFPEAERDLDQVRGHDNGRDIIGTGEWVIQVKRRAVMTRGVVLSGLAEARRSTTFDTPLAAVVHRSDRHIWRVTFHIDDLSWFFVGSKWFGKPITATMSLDDFCEIVLEVE